MTDSSVTGWAASVDPRHNLQAQLLETTLRDVAEVHDMMRSRLQTVRHPTGREHRRAPAGSVAGMDLLLAPVHAADLRERVLETTFYARQRSLTDFLA
jgi:hypothetical protein